jgi:hypothetical protein
MGLRATIPCSSSLVSLGNCDANIKAMVDPLECPTYIMEPFFPVTLATSFKLAFRSLAELSSRLKHSSKESRTTPTKLALLIHTNQNELFFSLEVPVLGIRGFVFCMLL